MSERDEGDESPAQRLPSRPSKPASDDPRHPRPWVSAPVAFAVAAAFVILLLILAFVRGPA